MARTPVPLTQLDRRPPEAGRIRMGEKTDRAMRSLDTFRFTSPDQSLIAAVAQLYGGTVRPWNEPRAKVKQQWQVTITAQRDRRLHAPGRPVDLVRDVGWWRLSAPL
jgi:hypothetical protein